MKKFTASLPRSHHALDDVLSSPHIQRILKWITRRGPDGKCLFERLHESYDTRPPELGAGLQWAHLDKKTMKRQLFHHPPAVKALAPVAKSIAAHGLTVPQRYTAALFVVWNITQACKLSCWHCYQNARRRPLEDELTTAEELDGIDQFADGFVPFLAFAGGEPLVSKDFDQALARCRERGIHVTVATNGKLLTPECCARLKQAGVKYVEVSIDSVDPGEHDRFRGLEGAWARSVQGIKNAVAAGIRTGMAVCFTRETARTLDDCIRFAEELGCHTFSHFNFIPVGRGREILDRDLTPAQRELLLERLTHHPRHSKLTVISTSPATKRARRP